MKAGIVVDNWKLPTFRRILTEAGYTYEDGGAFTGDMTILRVETDNMIVLQAVVKRCQREAKRA